MSMPQLAVVSAIVLACSSLVHALFPSSHVMLVLATCLSAVLAYAIVVPSLSAKRLTTRRGSELSSPRLGRSGSSTVVPHEDVDDDLNVLVRRPKLRVGEDVAAVDVLLQMGLPPTVAQPTAQITENALRDFVQSWYHDISPDRGFVNDARSMLIDGVGDLVMRLSHLNSAVFSLGEVAPLLQRTLHEFQECRLHALQLDPTLSWERPEELEAAIIAAGMRLRHKDEAAFAQRWANEVLVRVLADEDANCAALVHLLREIVAYKIVLPALDGVHPYIINSVCTHFLTAPPPPPTTPTTTTPASETPVETANSTLDGCASGRQLREAIEASVEEALTAAVIASQSANAHQLMDALLAVFCDGCVDAASEGCWPWLALASPASPIVASAVELVREAAQKLGRLDAHGADFRAMALFALLLNRNALATAMEFLLVKNDDDEIAANTRKAYSASAPVVLAGGELVAVLRALDDVNFALSLDAFWSHVKASAAAAAPASPTSRSAHRRDSRAPGGGGGGGSSSKEGFALVDLAVVGSEIVVDESDGEDKPFVVYVIRVRAQTTDGALEEWLLRRRYSSFDRLAQQLRARYPRMGAHLPSKRGLRRVLFNESHFSLEFREERGGKLGVFLSQLVDDPYTRDAPELTDFLMAERVITQHSSSAASSAAAAAATMATGEDDSVLSAAATEQLLPPLGGAAPGNSHRQLVDVERNLYSLFDVVLLLQKGRFSFLRERVVVIARTIVKQSFRGRIYQVVTQWNDEGNNVEALTSVLELALSTVWPNGKLMTPAPLPDEVTQARKRVETFKLLSGALPPSIKRLLGQSHCDLIATTFFDFMQCRRIVRSFVCEVLALLASRCFPDLPPGFARRVVQN